MLSNNKQFHSTFKHTFVFSLSPNPWAILLNMADTDLQSKEHLTTGFAIPYYDLDFHSFFKGPVARLCKEESEFCYQDGLLWEQQPNLCPLNLILHYKVWISLFSETVYKHLLGMFPKYTYFIHDLQNNIREPEWI